MRGALLLYITGIMSASLLPYKKDRETDDYGCKTDYHI